MTIFFSACEASHSKDSSVPRLNSVVICEISNVSGNLNVVFFCQGENLWNSAFSSALYMNLLVIRDRCINAHSTATHVVFNLQGHTALMFSREVVLWGTVDITWMTGTAKYKITWLWSTLFWSRLFTDMSIFSWDIQTLSSVVWFSQQWLPAGEWCEHRAFLWTADYQPDEAGEGQSVCLWLPCYI